MTTHETMKKGELLFEQGNLPEAEQIFLHVLENDPKNKEALNNLGVLNFAQRNPEKAITFLTEALNADPLYFDALDNLCAIFKSTSSLASAYPFIERAIELDQNDNRLRCLLRDVDAKLHTQDGPDNHELANQVKNARVDVSKKCHRERPLRVVHLPVVIANNAPTLSKYLNRLGIKSTVISYFRTWLGYQGDINLDLDGLSIGDRNKKVASFVDDFLKNEAHKYDIFHFHFFDSLSTGTSFGGWTSHPHRENYWDLEYLKSLGKKIVISSWGSDTRNNSKMIYYQLQYEQVNATLPYPPLNTKDQYSKLWTFARYADVIVHGDTETVNHTPNGIMIPIGIDLEPIEQLKKETNNVPTRPSIIHAPSNHLYKGTVYVDKILAKLSHLKGDKFEVRKIHGIPYRNAIKAYLGKGAAIDQIGVFSFGLFALEALYLGRTVFTSLRKEEFFGDDPKLRAPVVPISDETSFYEHLSHFVTTDLIDRSDGYRQFVQDHFAADLIARKYKGLYERLMNGEIIQQYVSPQWHKEFNLLISHQPVDATKYYPKVTDLLLARGHFDKLYHEVRMGIGLTDDVDLLAKWLIALELTNQKDDAARVRATNTNLVASDSFKHAYNRAKNLCSSSARFCCSP